jgi:crossover junction endodeoxyribonuclease RusA
MAEGEEGMNSVTFPWPSKDLSPNSRGHWSKKAKAAKAYRLDCFYLAKEAGVTAPAEGPIHLHIEFVPPDRRGRDLDNMLASAKQLLDGLAEAMKVNDKRFAMALSVSDQIGGMVKVRID